MDSYTETHTAGDGKGRLFCDQLAALAVEVDLPKPEFRGKALPFVVGQPARWQIETRIRGRTVTPETPDEVYTRIYPDWSTGVEMAMLGALSRLCYQYRTVIPRETFYQYGWRSMEGVPVLRTVPAQKTTSCKNQLSHLECLAARVEDILEDEMKDHDETKAAYRQMRNTAIDQAERIKLLENTIWNMGSRIDELETEKNKLEAQIEKKDAQIFGWQAQSAFFAGQKTPPPAPESTVAQSSVAAQDSLAVQQTPVAPEDQEMEEEEEDPEEVNFILPNGEERLIVSDDQDYPATNTRSHTPRMSAKTYVNLFKVKI